MLKYINTAVNPFYETDKGAAFLGDSLNLLKLIPDNSVDLILTSPPFALTRQKEYGNKQEQEYLDWFMQFASEFYRLMKSSGSLVVDLGGAYLPGHPTRSIYQYELLVRLCRELNFFLAQEFFHYNPARLPTPAEWVTVRRIRVKDSVNIVWWLSKTENPKSDNRKVLKPYSDSMKSLLKNGYKAQMRPSGHDISEKFNTDNGGAIPPNFLEMSDFVDNVLELANTESNSHYMKRCKEIGIKAHPARFPKNFADFFIKFITDEGDWVLDPFSGSNTTGYAAELLNRKWISFEINEAYLEASKVRFEEEPTLFNQEPKLNGKIKTQKV